MEKDFRYTIRTKSSKIVVAEQIVTFGSEDRPFPDDWKNDVHVQLALQDHKQKFFAEVFDVEISEDLSETEIKPMFTIEQIKKYILSQDSLGDVMYNLNADKIKEANKVSHECPECGDDIEEDEWNKEVELCNYCFDAVRGEIGEENL